MFEGVTAMLHGRPTFRVRAGRGSRHNLQVKVCSSEAKRASSGSLVNYSNNTK